MFQSGFNHWYTTNYSCGEKSSQLRIPHGKDTKQNAELIKTQRIFAGEKVYECNECGKTFSQSSSLLSTREFIRGRNLYKCNVYVRSTSLNVPHLLYIKEFILERNPTNVMNVENLQSEHEPYCSTKNSYWRETINVKSVEKLSARIHPFIQHERIHNEKPYKCNECGKAFTKVWISQYQRTHTGEKPKECNECGKSLQSKYASYCTSEKSYWRKTLWV